MIMIRYESVGHVCEPDHVCLGDQANAIVEAMIDFRLVNLTPIETPVCFRKVSPFIINDVHTSRILLLTCERNLIISALKL